MKKNCVLALSAACVILSCQSSLLFAKEGTQAQQAFQQAFSKDSFVEQLQETLDTSSVKDALALFEELPADQREDFDLMYLKAALNLSAGNYKEASAICSSLNQKNPGNTDVMELGLTVAIAGGNTKEKNRLVKALLEKDKYNVTANISLADDYFRKKNYKQSRIYYSKALSREPSNEDALLGVGRASYFMEDDEKAEETFNTIVKNNPSSASAYSYLGKIAAASSKNKKAADYAAKALELEPENYDYNLDYGLYESVMGHYDNAIGAWTKAIEIQPDYFLAYAYRAGLYDQEEELDKALDDYRNVVKYNPDYYFAWESIGVIELHKQNWASARAAFEKCYEKQKDNISYPLMITFCYFKEKNPMKAKSFSDKVLSKTDKSTIEYAMLRCYHDQGGGAMPLPQKISTIQSRQKQGKMYFYMGLLSELYSSTTESNEWYAKVLAMNSPMFFEYRLAEWSVGNKNAN